MLEPDYANESKRFEVLKLALEFCTYNPDNMTEATLISTAQGMLDWIEMGNDEVQD